MGMSDSAKMLPIRGPKFGADLAFAGANCGRGAHVRGSDTIRRIVPGQNWRRKCGASSDSWAPSALLRANIWLLELRAGIERQIPGINPPEPRPDTTKKGSPKFAEHATDFRGWTARSAASALEILNEASCSRNSSTRSAAARASLAPAAAVSCASSNNNLPACCACSCALGAASGAGAEFFRAGFVLGCLLQARRRGQR